MRKRDLNHLIENEKHQTDLEALYERFDDADLRTEARTRAFRDEDERRPNSRGRLTEEGVAQLFRERETEEIDDGPPYGYRWTTWDDPDAMRGPEPYPDWLITHLGAVDEQHGILKTGKEADVFLIERSVPDTDQTMLLASKRYRSGDHRMFHRDAGYLEGRRSRKSRERRAVANRSAFGRNLIAQQWAIAEFDVLGELWNAGAPVPYPVQRIGTELLMEFIGDREGGAAPRLAQLRPEPDELAELWRQLVEAMALLGRLGYTHGDLSAFNLLVHNGTLMLIDLPQVVDVIANPQGHTFLERDASNISHWFQARGMAHDLADPMTLIDLVRTEAGL